MEITKRKGGMQVGINTDLSKLYYDNTEIEIIFKISYSTIYRWRNAKILKFRKVGSKYYYPREVIERMMKIRDE
ncbi:helix-turn-helix domain-containing protein [Flavobacterium sp. SM2513]|uniref:helix-turn-helix domain-containing protein n=1 Tax=Flavobacterium sp. SM2513 TaxID=3424766 RepID=UPI003D7FC0E1